MSAALMLPPKAADYVTCLDVTTLMKHMLLPCCYRCYHPWLQHLLPVMMSLNSADSLLPCITPEGLQNICYLSWCYHPGLQHSEFVFLTNIFFRHINYTLFLNRSYSMNCFVFTFVLVIFIFNYRVFIKYCVFSLTFCDFSELCQFCCSAGVLPAWYVYTHWHRGRTEKGQSPGYISKSSKTHNI